MGSGCGGQGVAQVGQAVANTKFDDVGADPEQVGDLLVGEAGVVGQVNRLAVLSGERVECFRGMVEVNSGVLHGEANFLDVTMKMQRSVAR